MSKKILSLIVLIIVALGIVYLSTSKKSTVSSDTITVGYIGPLTGPSAVLGMDAIKAIEIAVDEANSTGGVNGKKIKLVAEDDQYLTKNTVNAYTKLAHVNNAKIILIATYGGVFAVKDLALKDNVLIIDPLDCNSDVVNIEKNILCIATETESIGHTLADRMVSQGNTRAAVMFSTKDTFMALVNKAFTEHFTQGGGSVVTEAFNYEDTDFRSQLTKIKQSNPQGLVLLGHDETGTIMKQARQLGIKVPFYATGTITSPSAQQLSQGASEGTYFAYWEAGPTNPLAQAFNQKFIAKVGRGPILPLTTHPAYDSLTILFTKVLPQVSDLNNINEIKSALLKVQNYQGTTGTISFGADGSARIKESLYQLVKGNAVKI